MMDIVIEIMLYLAGFFSVLGAIGMLRFPDFYTRSHAATMMNVGGVVLALSALLITQLWALSIYSWKTMLIIFLIMLVNPAGTHAVAAAAYKSGIKPKKKEEK